MMRPLMLSADKDAVTTAKILAAGRFAGVDIQVSPGGGKTPCGLNSPELRLPSGVTVRNTNAVLRRVASFVECGLMGGSFVEEGQVDSWLEWASLEIDHHTLDPSYDVKPLCEVLEMHLKSRTFLVGQRFSLADLSAACSLREPMNKAGLDKLRAAFPATVRWFQTCIHQPALAASAAPASAAAPAKTAQKKESTPAPAKPAQAEKKSPQSKHAASPDASPKTKPAAAPGSPPSGPAAEPNEEGGKNADKNAEKKAKKEAEKKAKEDEKKKREDEQQKQRDNKFKGPELTLLDFQDHKFGNLFIQSQKRTGRTWTTVGGLIPKLKDQSVWVRARVHNSRKQGNKLCFLTLREGLHTVQAVIFGQEAAGFAGALPDESVVDIYGKIASPEAPINSCSQSDVELSVENIYCIGRSTALPLQLADAGRPEEDFEKDPTLVKVNQDTRLDNRIIDLRTVANQAIFRIQSGVCELFRGYLLGLKFQEIHTPKLIGGASEGGADVFEVKYFEGAAFLAQSPQLYKQMALMTDMPRVFEIGPIFRSERSFTHRHMTEFTGLDLEMTFKDHYYEVLDVIDGLFNHIFTGLTKSYQQEIEAVRAQYPFEDLKWKHPCLRITFAEGVGLLRKHGPAVLEKRLKDATTDYERGLIQKHLESVKKHEDEEDISTEDEKVLGVVIEEKYGEQLYIIDKFPKDTRPFYTMPDPVDPRWTNAYDVFLRGEEITSGAQRIHDPKMLAEKCEAIGVPVSSIQSYVDAFKYGSFPHGGAGIGMERVVMLFLKLNNIRKSSMFPRDPKRLTP